MAKNQTVPLICGGVYEFIDPRSQLPERVSVFATKRQVGGVLMGLARSVDGAYEKEFTEGSENMLGWSLVAKPVELAEPISAGNIVETENAALKLSDDHLVELAAQGTTWSSIGRPFDMGWKEVKERFDALVAEGQTASASPAAKLAARYARKAAKGKSSTKGVTAPTETKPPVGATA